MGAFIGIEILDFKGSFIRGISMTSSLNEKLSGFIFF